MGAPLAAAPPPTAPMVAPSAEPVTEVEVALPTQVYAEPPEVFAKALRPLPKFTPAPPPKLLRPDDIEAEPMLTSLHGAGSIAVRGKGNVVRSVREGGALRAGDFFQTGDKASARVSYESGIELLLAPGSVVRLGDQEPGGSVSKPTAVAVWLDRGEARVLVRDAAKSAADALDQTEARLKLVVVTPQAAVGVKGTDFVLNVTDKSTSVRMLKGTVEVSKDVAAVRASRGVRALGMPEMIEIHADRPLPAVEAYERAVFIKEFVDRYPDVDGFWTMALRDAKSRRLAPAFERLRIAQIDEVNQRNGFAPEKVRREQESRERRVSAQRKHEQGVLEEKKAGSPGPKSSGKPASGGINR